jgi:hypothetical protein
MLWKILNFTLGGQSWDSSPGLSVCMTSALLSCPLSPWTQAANSHGSQGVREVPVSFVLCPTQRDFPILLVLRTVVCATNWSSDATEKIEVSSSVPASPGLRPFSLN